MRIRLVVFVVTAKSQVSQQNIILTEAFKAPTGYLRLNYEIRNAVQSYKRNPYLDIHFLSVITLKQPPPPQMLIMAEKDR